METKVIPLLEEAIQIVRKISSSNEDMHAFLKKHGKPGDCRLTDLKEWIADQITK